MSIRGGGARGRVTNGHLSIDRLSISTQSPIEQEGQPHPRFAKLGGYLRVCHFKVVRREPVITSGISVPAEVRPKMGVIRPRHSVGR
jgi:hypothetical protein